MTCRSRRRLSTRRQSARAAKRHRPAGTGGRASSMWGGGRSRRDAHFYNPTAAAVAASLRRHGETEPLAGVTDRVFGVPRFKHVYLGHGVPYLDSEDLFKVNPELTKFIPSISDKARTTYFVQRGWVLMACSGQLDGLNGSAVLAGPWHENKIISNHVNRIVPGHGIRPGYLQMAVGHPTLGRPLALRFAFGSSVPEIAAEDLRSFPIARLGDDQEAALPGRWTRRLGCVTKRTKSRTALPAWLTATSPVRWPRRLLPASNRGSVTVRDATDAGPRGMITGTGPTFGPDRGAPTPSSGCHDAANARSRSPTTTGTGSTWRAVSSACRRFATWPRRSGAHRSRDRAATAPIRAT